MKKTEIALIVVGAAVLSNAAYIRALYALATNNPDRAWMILQAGDRLVNAGSNGDPAEYISSRAARARRENRRWGCILCKLLDRVDPGHCDQFDPPTMLRADAEKPLP